ncbi:MAG: glycosyltransferase family 4 protein [Bacteroidales bacterium]|nr:glycosyltransferase family 4 protein [Bacteroidales bacterium]
MKILLLPAYFFPEQAASSFLAENKYQAFADAGFDMVAYVPTPCRGISSEKRVEYCAKPHRSELMYDGKLLVHRFSLYSEGKSAILRALRYSLCWIKQFNRALIAKDINVIYLASTPPIQGMLGALLSKIKKVPFVYNLQDIFPDSLVGTGLARKGGVLWKIGREIENFTYRNAQIIIVISEDFKKNIMAKGVPEEKIAVIYNWVDEKAVVDVPREDNKLFDKYGLDRSLFYICYSGNIGLTQNMDMLLEVMEELKEEYPDIHLILVGEGAYKQQVEAIVARDELNNVHMIPFQPYEDISSVFSIGDVGLVISKPGVGANSVPSKTWSIMSASRPVLANFDENELRDIINKHRSGLFTKAGDKEAFKESILALYYNRAKCLEYGRNGRQFVINNLTRKAGTHRYVDVIKRFDNDAEV